MSALYSLILETQYVLNTDYLHHDWCEMMGIDAEIAEEISELIYTEMPLPETKDYSLHNFDDTGESVSTKLSLESDGDIEIEYINNDDGYYKYGKEMKKLGCSKKKYVDEYILEKKFKEEYCGQLNNKNEENDEEDEEDEDEDDIKKKENNKEDEEEEEDEEDETKLDFNELIPTKSYKVNKVIGSIRAKAYSKSFTKSTHCSSHQGCRNLDDEEQVDMFYRYFWKLNKNNATFLINVMKYDNHKIHGEITFIGTKHSFNHASCNTDGANCTSAEKNPFVGKPFKFEITFVVDVENKTIVLTLVPRICL